MAYNAYITRIKNLHKHPNADRLQIGECFGNSIVVSLDYEDNQLGIYFPSDGQLSVEFADANNLLRKKDENGNNLHDTEKPVKLMEILIENSTNKGEIVFEPFAGIGSTLIAARNLERKVIGSELDSTFAEIVIKRLKNEKFSKKEINQEELF